MLTLNEKKNVVIQEDDNSVGNVENIIIHLEANIYIIIKQDINIKHLRQCVIQPNDNINMTIQSYNFKWQW
jgi:hypothetical protein